MTVVKSLNKWKTRRKIRYVPVREDQWIPWGISQYMKWLLGVDKHACSALVLPPNYQYKLKCEMDRLLNGRQLVPLNLRPDLLLSPSCVQTGLPSDLFFWFCPPVVTLACVLDFAFCFLILYFAAQLLLTLDLQQTPAPLAMWLME